MKKRKSYQRKKTPILITVFGLILSGVVFLFSNFVEVTHFSEEADYQVCFTPDQNCTTLITQAIQSAKEQVHMQAYGLTSKPIIAALRSVAQRGVQVKVILDKSHLLQPEVATLLVKNQVLVWIDKPAGIAHNKVLIIDQDRVLTGSFNWTYSAQHRNTENVLLIKETELARSYLDNWHRRCARAIPFKPVKSHSKNTTIGTANQSFWKQLLDGIMEILSS